FIYGLHRNPDVWEDPEAFRPERMSAENKKKFLSHQYIPFGGGPRLCIGHQFAVVEMQIALAMLFQRFEFERIGNEPVSMIPSITLRPGDPIHFRFWERG
ncbi:MAG: cytochrome P450, partial [Bacteroidia bacterium]|nr:cytochrome P450 [Bacteroidia bacterium]